MDRYVKLYALNFSLKDDAYMVNIALLSYTR